MPLVPMMSLQAHGTPVRTGASALLRRTSAAAACAFACAGSRLSQALYGSAVAASRYAAVSSAADSSRARSFCATSVIVRGRSRIGALLEARLHAEEVTFPVRCLRQDHLHRETRTRLVLAHDVLEREHRSAGLHRGGIHVLQLLDRLEDDLELPGEPVQLVVGERDAGEPGDVLDPGPIDVRHIVSLCTRSA